MTIDVIDLRNFYSTRLGVVARRLINRGIRARWHNAQGQRVLGVGYCTPYLGLFREDAERCLAFMPAAQGVMKWPTARPTLAALVDELELPLPDSSVDRILLMHALEVSDDPAELLREMWRVLTPSGRMIIVLPNRRGPWARADNTPFGHGRPYSRSQVTQLLRETWFTPAAWSEALHMPPIRYSWFLRSAIAWERIRLGDRLALRGRSHRRGDQAGLSPDRGPARAAQAHPGDGAGAGADDVAARHARKKLSRKAVSPAAQLIT